MIGFWGQATLLVIGYLFSGLHVSISMPAFPTSHQSIGTVSIGYTLLGQTRAGAVDWRSPAEGGPVDP